VVGMSAMCDINGCQSNMTLGNVKGSFLVQRTQDERPEGSRMNR
jgi:hypothetical protein